MFAFLYVSVHGDDDEADDASAYLFVSLGCILLWVSLGHEFVFFDDVEGVFLVVFYCILNNFILKVNLVFIEVDVWLENSYFDGQFVPLGLFLQELSELGSESFTEDDFSEPADETEV